MTKQYNPNDYVFLCQTSEGFVLAHNEVSDIIASVQNPDKVLGYTKDFNEICKLFTECLDIMAKGYYNVGDKISYANCQYFVLEVGENSEEGVQELIVAR